MVNNILDSYQSTKLGNAINIILKDLLLLNNGDKLKTIDEYVEKHHFSKGTYFNALVTIESKNFANFKRKGHIGTLVDEIDYLGIWRYLSGNKFSIVLPFPDDLSLKVLATAINNLLHNQKQIKSYLLYARGGETRSNLLKEDIVDLSVMTKLSYEIASAIDERFKLLYEVNHLHYRTNVTVLIKKGNQQKLAKQKVIRILYDEASYDVKLLANIIFKDNEIVFVNHSYNQTIDLLEENMVDAAIYSLSENDFSKYSGVEVMHFKDQIVNQKLNDASTIYLVYYDNDKIPLQKVVPMILSRDQMIEEYTSILKNHTILNF